MTTRIARQTGLPVTVCRAEDEGLDAEGGVCAWYTICDEHGGAVGHATRRLAQYHAADPQGWCEYCMEEVIK